MFDQEYLRPGIEIAAEGRRGVAEEAPLAGTVLLDEDLDAVAGGLSHIGEEIPQ
jgi:hypothetical protein